MEKQHSCAQRFVNAYNKIDSVLRNMYGFKRTMTFTDVVHRSVLLNSVVRKYEDDLIDYGRLRNAIIHKSNPDYVIAEPHLEVVEKMESLAQILSTPPLALDRISKKEVLCIKADMPLKQAMQIMSRSGYSNLPVYQENELIGILNGQRTMDVLGSEVAKGTNLQEYIENTSAGQVITLVEDEKYFAVADENITIENVMNLFENNKKLTLVLITKSASLKYPPLGIITITDVVEMQKVLDVY